MTRKKKVEPVVFNEPPIPDIFADLEAQTAKRGTYKEGEGKRRSVEFGACPLCSIRRIGLVRQGEHLAWREHTFQTHGGLSLQCSATGQHLCDLPGRDVSDFTGETPPTCSCRK